MDESVLHDPAEVEKYTMDPDETLRQILSRIDDFEEADAHTRHFEALELAHDLVMKMADLDCWMRRGGYLPLRWSRAGAERHP